ncbi:MAG: hypothetical protein RDV48_02670 [Candidatus Eremiobacteraeota bacterium]|nr:hypothetical protein [Candidatus Eremiobacteraeota bacterium]
MYASSVPSASSYAYTSPSVSLAGWQTSDYEQQYKYWDYSKEQRLEWVKNEIEKNKYELANVEYRVNTNQGKLDEIARKREYIKGELWRNNNELSKANDRKADAEGRRYTVKEKMRYAEGSDLHSLAREKERLDDEIMKLYDTITSCQWKINDLNSEFNSLSSAVDSINNENYYAKDNASNLRYKLKELMYEKDRLEREKAAG